VYTVSWIGRAIGCRRLPISALSLCVYQAAAAAADAAGQHLSVGDKGGARWTELGTPARRQLTDRRRRHLPAAAAGADPVATRDAVVVV